MITPQTSPQAFMNCHFLVSVIGLLQSVSANPGRGVVSILWPLSGSRLVSTTHIDIDINLDWNADASDHASTSALIQAAPNDFNLCFSSGMDGTQNADCQELVRGETPSKFAVFQDSSSSLGAVWVWIEPKSHNGISPSNSLPEAVDAVFLWPQMSASLAASELKHHLRLSANHFAVSLLARNALLAQEQAAQEIKESGSAENVCLVTIDYPLNSSSVRSALAVEIAVDLSSISTKPSSEGNHQLVAALSNNPDSILMCHRFVIWEGVAHGESAAPPTCLGLFEPNALKLAWLTPGQWWRVEAWVQITNANLLENESSDRYALITSTFWVSGTPEHCKGHVNISAAGEKKRSGREEEAVLVTLPPLRHPDQVCRTHRRDFGDRPSSSSAVGSRYDRVDAGTWNRRKWDGYSTHQPILAHYARGTAEASISPSPERTSELGSGQMWEFGCGFGSTPMLRQFAKDSDRKLVSVESDAAWLVEMKARLPESNYHHYSLVDTMGDGISSKDAVVDDASVLNALVVQENLLLARWRAFFKRLSTEQPLGIFEVDMVFIDCKPEYARWLAIQHFSHRARYLILHDAPFSEYFSDTGGLFRRSTLYLSRFCNGPSTQVLTNRDDCEFSAEKDIFGIIDFF